MAYQRPEMNIRAPLKERPSTNHRSANGIKLRIGDCYRCGYSFGDGEICKICECADGRNWEVLSRA